MARRRHTPQQVVRKLREGERLLGEGKDLGEVCRHLEVSEQTWHRWRNQYGGMKAEDTKRLKELERENQRLKKLVAEQASTSTCSRRSAGETGEPRPSAASGGCARRAVRGFAAACLPGGRPTPFGAAVCAATIRWRRTAVACPIAGDRPRASSVGLAQSARHRHLRRSGGQSQTHAPIVERRTARRDGSPT